MAEGGEHVLPESPRVLGVLRRERHLSQSEELIVLAQEDAGDMEDRPGKDPLDPRELERVWSPVFHVDHPGADRLGRGGPTGHGDGHKGGWTLGHGSWTTFSDPKRPWTNSP